MQSHITTLQSGRASGSANPAAEIDMLAFKALVQTYEAARRAWVLSYTGNEDYFSEQEEAAFERFSAVELKLLSFPCTSVDIAVCKASYIWADPEMRERIGGSNDDKRLNAFLSSLLQLKGGAA